MPYSVMRRRPLRREVLMPVPPPARLVRVLDRGLDIASGAALVALSLSWLLLALDSWMH